MGHFSFIGIWLLSTGPYTSEVLQWTNKVFRLTNLIASSKFNVEKILFCTTVIGVSKQALTFAWDARLKIISGWEISNVLITDDKSQRSHS